MLRPSVTVRRRKLAKGMLGGFDTHGGSGLVVGTNRKKGECKQQCVEDKVQVATGRRETVTATWKLWVKVK
jgi:hypothetical protein